MNRTKLKNYAPQARRDFIQAMTDRAAYFGLTAKKTEPVVEKGDVAVIGGRSFAIAVAKKRKALEDRIKRHGPDWSKGFAQTMEAMAYTWFNRLVAIRFMELHGYLEHGYRVLSHPEGKPTPEILEHAEHVELPGLKREVVIDLKLAGNKEGELYRLLLTAQCNALHTAMPFLFERIDDETELLLPDNLLNSDSLMCKLVGEIEEEDWNEVEIIGWMYQFYISEKKDEVIGKVVASEDIPAATQLFTPNWIVKYLVQNTLGRQWLATYPQSALRQQMEYYIEPAEQTPEVLEQLKAITPTSLNPEELTLLDPACGSGHILVEAYDLFKAIYQERGYRAKDIPVLILQKNLFGMEIDDRAAQLAAFALMMKARADDRRIFEIDVKLHVISIQESTRLDAEEITEALNKPLEQGSSAGDISRADVARLIELFEHGKMFGSLIQVPEQLAMRLTTIARRVKDVGEYGGMFEQAAARSFGPILTQANQLICRYMNVVTNPPFISTKFMTPQLKSFAKSFYADVKADVFSMFIERCANLSASHGMLGFVTPYVWMFLGSYDKLRAFIMQRTAITSLVQLEYNAFEPACVPVCTFTLLNSHLPGLKGDYIKLTDFRGHQNQATRTIEAIHNPACGWRHATSTEDFSKIPGGPIAFAVSDAMRDTFVRLPAMSDIANPQVGLQTSDNARFVRHWYEVSFKSIELHAASNEDALRSGKRWFPHHKGGDYQKWYGNRELVVNWELDGREIKEYVAERYPYLNGNVDYVVKDRGLFFRPGAAWSHTTTGTFSSRYIPAGSISNVEGPTLFSSGDIIPFVGLLNSTSAVAILGLLSPTLHFLVGTMRLLPVPDKELRTNNDYMTDIAQQAIDLAKSDYDCCETSWEFSRHPFIQPECVLIRSCFGQWIAECQSKIEKMCELEEANNRVFAEAYGLEDEVPIEVPESLITLYRPNQEEDIKRLASYAIGCMMGRYSLDKPGLVYAQCGNHGFDASQYKVFPADEDGILPLTEFNWFPDDAASRFEKFVATAWPIENLEGNLKFVAESLGAKRGESPLDSIRRYLATGFYKHHLSMYKKRPIYWLFSSGKQRAFQCLVYLHRYHEGTLARMRTEYVIPLQGQISARIEQLEGDKAKATSTSHRKKLQKEQDDLKKQRTELLTFEEKLKHAADQKISLDLDDGVKLNYAKFGDLLAEVKSIAGGKEDD